MREDARPFRTYSGGQFICSKEGYFCPDMMFAGSSVPSFLQPTSKNLTYELEVPDDVKLLEGDRYVFMGAFHAHFGHCLVESLSRLWFIIDLTREERRYFKFVFFQGWGIEDGPLYELLAWLGVPRENVIVLVENILFRRLIIPTSAWRPWNQWDIYLDATLFAVFKELRQLALMKYSGELKGERIYLSRSLLNQGGRQFNRRELDPGTEKFIEDDLRSRGYDIIHPERLSVLEQINLIATASHIVGPGGSAHHLAAFAYDAVTQVVLTHEGFWMGGNDAVFIWDKPTELSYVFGRQIDPTIPSLVAPWDISAYDWEVASNIFNV